MIRTLIAVVVLCAAIVWLPVAMQIVLFVLAIIVVPYRLVLLLPAIFSDVLYSPTPVISLAHSTMTIIVGVLLVVHWLITTHTRIRYGRSS